VVFADDPDDTYSGVVERIANIAEETNPTGRLSR
jgi:hypothetical protein